MARRLEAPISRIEYLDCTKHGIPIHKHWHVDGETVEFYWLNEERAEIAGNLRDYVSPSHEETTVISVQTIDSLDWEEFEEKASEGNCLLIPEEPGKYQYVFYPEFLKHKVTEE